MTRLAYNNVCRFYFIFIDYANNDNPPHQGYFSVYFYFYFRRLQWPRMTMVIPPWRGLLFFLLPLPTISIIHPTAARFGPQSLSDTNHPFSTPTAPFQHQLPFLYTYPPVSDTNCPFLTPTTRFVHLTALFDTIHLFYPPNHLFLTPVFKVLFYLIVKRGFYIVVWM